MYKICFAVAAAALLSCNSTNRTTMQSNNTSNAASEEGFVSLFDGQSTKGWHTYGKTGVGKAWKAVDGTLFLDAASKKDWQTAEGGDIVSDEEFENFHLKLEWKISPKGNSGVIIYTKEDPQYQYMWQTGPEMQVLDNGTETAPGHPDAKITTHRAGDLYDLIVAKEVVKPVGEWNAAEIVSNNGKLDFYLNGQHTLSTTMWDDAWRAMIAKSKFKDMTAFGTYKKGRIGLQDHGDNVWFRNIRIKRL
ncbi:MAG TPA: DUF1080 domain-containing protein [Flavisolibacter sp.]|nr:DUF1080 domain-containing protein [Flavisolibacter sp.]